jgi:hypothetical protein
MGSINKLPRITQQLRSCDFPWGPYRGVILETIGANRALSSLAWKPGPWVRIPLRAWMFSVCVCVFLCLCTGRGLATSWSPAQGVPPTVPDQETEKTQPYAPKAGASSQVWEQRGWKKKERGPPFSCHELGRNYIGVTSYFNSNATENCSHESITFMYTLWYLHT